MTLVAYAVLVERKVRAFIQDRVGPNRTTPFFAKFIPVLGPLLTRWGIFPADGRRLEGDPQGGLHAGHVRKIYFWLAPAIAVIPGAADAGGDSLRIDAGRRRW
jgi:NADH-quinone oxidoreductase subunit H